MEISEMKDELLPVIKRMPAYIKLSIALYKEPELGRGAKTLLAAGVLYALSPIDLIPGFIPVAGQLDDIIVGLEALKRAMRGLT
ncbi:MAG TPA: YkvA family protein, partial [Desulfobacteria bacterium]|nr:YkvA family protein [Desulfobacteria bacterium]